MTKPVIFSSESGAATFFSLCSTVCMLLSAQLIELIDMAGKDFRVSNDHTLMTDRRC